MVEHAAAHHAAADHHHPRLRLHAPVSRSPTSTDLIARGGSANSLVNRRQLASIHHRTRNAPDAARRMRLADPKLLLLLLLVPVVIGLLRHGVRPRAIGFPMSGELRQLSPSLAVRLHQALPWLRALVLGLGVLALAGPEWGVETAVIIENIAIALVIDTSSSMSAIDLKQGDRPSNRLDVVKATLRISSPAAPLPAALPKAAAAAMRSRWSPLRATPIRARRPSTTRLLEAARSGQHGRAADRGRHRDRRCDRARDRSARPGPGRQQGDRAADRRQLQRGRGRAADRRPDRRGLWHQDSHHRRRLTWHGADAGRRRRRGCRVAARR